MSTESALRSPRTTCSIAALVAGATAVHERFDVTKIVFVDSQGRRTEVDAPIGDTVMRAARNAGVKSILGECGGSMSCLTCHCFVAPGSAIPPPSEDERALLDCVLEQRETSRLSCQILVSAHLEGTVFELPQWQG